MSSYKQPESFPLEKDDGAKKGYGSIVQNKVETPNKPSECWGTRHTFALMSFLGLANIYAMRFNMSVAIVAMTNADTGFSNDSTVGQECPFPAELLQNTTSTGEFSWDAKQQGIILGAFFYGCIATQLPGGYLAEKFGGKLFLLLGTLTAAIFSLASVPAARHSDAAFIAVRVIIGLGEGVTFPAMQALISKWVPSFERSRLGTVIWAGTQAGSMIALALSGALADRFGWEWIFYFFGISGCVWCSAWYFLCFDSPDKHPRISEAERRYIESNIPSKNQGTTLPFPPLIQIFTTPAFLALILVHFGNNWGLYMLLTEIPTYLNNVQHLPLKQNGLLSALPYLGGFLTIPIGMMADYLIVSEKLKTVNVRRLVQVIGHYGPALALVALANVGCNQTWAVVCLFLSVALASASYGGFHLNHVELSPNYAGTLMGITNMVANSCGVIAPFVAGVITQDSQTISSWGYVFYLTSAIYFTFNTIYLIFISSSVQPWNTYWEKKEEK